MASRRVFGSLLFCFVIRACTTFMPRGVCPTKCHWSVWNTKLPLLTDPLRSHWLWQVAWRCQETVISFICESSAQGHAPFPAVSSVCQKREGISQSSASHPSHIPLLNCRIEARMSKSAAIQRSPSMVTESSKAVTSAAVEVTPGSKVSVSVSLCREVKSSRWACVS